MDISAIGSASIGMHLAQTQGQVGIALLKKSMSLQETQSAALIDSLQAAVPVPPSTGRLNMLI